MLNNTDQLVVADDLPTMSAEDYIEKGKSLHILGDMRGAIVCYDRAINLKHDYVLAYYNKGRALFTLGNDTEALKCYNMALKFDPNYVEAHNSKGLTLFRLEHIDAAVVCYNEALKLDPKFTSAYDNKLIALDKLNELDTLENGKTVKKTNEDGTSDPVFKELLEVGFEAVNTVKIYKEKVDIHGQTLVGHKKQITEQEQKLTEHESKFKDSGIDDKVKIKHKLEQLQKTSPELYNYCKTFIWSLTSYIESYRVSSADVLSLNTGNSLKESGAVYAVQKGVTTVLSAIPLVSNISSVFDNIVDTAYQSTKESKLKNKAEVINNIILKHHALPSDVEITLAKAVLAVADKSSARICSYKDIPSGKSILSKLEEKLNEAVDKVLRNKDIESTPASELAVKDVIALLAYLYMHNEEVELASFRGISLTEQLTAIVIKDTLAELLANSSAPEIKTGVHDDIKTDTPVLLPVLPSRSLSPSKDLSQIEKIFSKKDIKTIKDKAAAGHWDKSFLRFGMEVEEFTEESYIKNCFKKQFNKTARDAEVADARILIFKYICIGIMNGEDGNKYNCAEKFTLTFPELIIRIAIENKKFFLDDSITQACIIAINNAPDIDDALKQEVLTALQDISGAGSIDTATIADFGYHIGLNEYYGSGLNKILKLRLDNLPTKTEKITTLESTYLYTESKSDIQKMAVDVISNFQQGIKTLLVPCNLYSKHWVGLVFELDNSNNVSVKYLDSENNSLPQGLQAELQEAISEYGYNPAIEQQDVEQQQANNCGVEVIENFMLHVSGYRLPQEKALKFHSQLLEEYLLSEDSITALGQDSIYS